MKKVLLILIFLLIIVQIHGQSTKSNNLNFGLTCLIAVSDDSVVPGPGIDVAWYNTKIFGLFGMGAYLNIVMPIVTYENAGGNEYATGITASLLIGPNYMIYNNGVIAFPVTLGFHFNFVTPIDALDNFRINLGIGTNFDFIYMFNEKWSVYARMLAAYNFGAGGEFLAFPGFGAGFSF